MDEEMELKVAAAIRLLENVARIPLPGETVQYADDGIETYDSFDIDSELNAFYAIVEAARVITGVEPIGLLAGPPPEQKPLEVVDSKEGEVV